MEEGLEETLTLHRLALIEDFRWIFTTSNCIGSLNSQINKYIRKIKTGRYPLKGINEYPVHYFT
jgi:hypothetical protein